MLSTGPEKISRSSDKLASYLLCERCESDFKRDFDAPVVNALKRLDKQIQGSGFSARIPFSHNQFAQAIIAIVWRSCESNNWLYDKTNISPSHLRILKLLIEAPQEIILDFCSLSIDRIYDKAKVSFNQKNISEFIMAPIPLTVVNKKRSSITHFGFHLSFQGFLIALIVPILPYLKTRKAGYLRRGAMKLHAPPIEVQKYPPVWNLMISNYAKIVAGQVIKRIMKRHPR